MNNQWSENIDEFIRLANHHDVQMIMVGGGAVNFHGYQRHSADVDFWIKTDDENLSRLVLVFNEMNYEIQSFPQEVKDQKQNISVKFSPSELHLELITKFSSNRTFEEALANSEKVEISGEKILKWNVLSYPDLIDSKLNAKRPKDLLDIQQLEKINNKKG